VIKHIASGRVLIWKQIVIVKGKEATSMREVEIARAVSSEYLVRILDSFIEKGFLYLVMEYYEKGTLATGVEKVKKSGKPIAETVSFFLNYFCFFLMFIFVFDLICRSLLTLSGQLLVVLICFTRTESSIGM
jgi:serine/threonine protein kinase